MYPVTFHHWKSFCLYLKHFLSIDISCCVLFWLCSERGSGARWGRGAGDDDRKVHPGPPAGADRDRILHHVQLQPDAVSTRPQLHRHTGVREGPEGHFCEWTRSRQSSQLSRCDEQLMYELTWRSDGVYLNAPLSRQTSQKVNFTKCFDFATFYQ